MLLLIPGHAMHVRIRDSEGFVLVRDIYYEGLMAIVWDRVTVIEGFMLLRYSASE